ncbi:PSD1 and planctomycete cytochrome C domain-containing protein [Posidoniimonas corsicana]|uniref:PSD1 and planctomycete cytochrome C domain-containing protein n=1 Tax=Posidoniimonas corsicana TaxID=1938618 RepID=UPI0018D31D23|nr:PSD1 and planctomycete cytochrome C domain-containing protein [Posidoniimonas corsicana]
MLKPLLTTLACVLFAHPVWADWDFNRQVRPILSDKCFACHGPDSAHRAAGLRLDIEEAAKADLRGRRAIDHAAPAKSEVLARIESGDPHLMMPPPDSHKELTPTEKQTLREWIAAGAPYSPPWAYVPPRWTEPPTLDHGATSANWIDNFVLDRLRREGLTPAPPADPVTLARRLAFDLTGLPPAQAVVDAFAADPSDGAYERMVDRFLASPRFGERMAIHWLDLVRYADTVGYHGDQEQTVWPYRDYVIHSLNSNKPFSDFTVEQLAGDLLPDADTDDRIASGYNRLLQTSHEGGVQLKEYRAIYLADRVRNVSQVWMAATMGCSQCHDHKFDPLSIDEFYALGAFFADIDDEEHLRDQYAAANNRNPTLRAPELPVQSVYQRQRLAELELLIAEIESAGEPVDELTAKHERLAQTVSMPIAAATAPREVRVLPRGDWQDESGPVVRPAAPAALGWTAGDGQATRLDLARWLVDADDGAGLLTARVMANRYWALLWGEGLAPVQDDFGGQGRPPTHPKLLDNLAVEFVRSGWDVKHLMKQIVTSQAYRQSSVAPDELLERDPGNALLARQGRFRLPAEMIRDAALDASGLLVHELGGPSVRPYQPVDYYQHLNFPTRRYHADKDNNQWRRGVYVHWQRQFLHPMLKAFDAPTREECTARRARSNTPLATLTLLNDPTFVEAARVMAAEVVAAHATPDARVDEIFRRAVSRPADDLERQAVLSLVSAQHHHYADHTDEAAKLLGVGLHDRPSHADQAELAAWTFACRLALNLGEATTRN